jgi:hypothetical protein
MTANPAPGPAGGYRSPVDQGTEGPEQDIPAENRPRVPWFRRPELVAAVVGAVVLLAIGYSVGYSRGSAGLDQGSSPTTSVVTGPSSKAPPSTTASTINIATVVPVALPAVPVTTEGFDRIIPKAIAGHLVTTPSGAWTVADGAAEPSAPKPLADSATDARLAGQGPELFVALNQAPVLATIVLTEPTPFSGLVFRGTDDANYWALVPDARLANLTIYKVKDGKQTAVGFVDHPVKPGSSIGLADVGGQIGVVVDGATVAIQTFYGPKPSLPDDGIAGNRVGLLTGRGQPRFDNLTFG